MRFLNSNGATRLVMLLSAVLAPGLIALPSATASDGQVPFNARLSGSAAFTSPATVEFHGAGQATHLGRFVGSGVALLEAPTGRCPGGTSGIPNVHTETLTAANGDELVLRMVNVGCPTGPFTFHGTGHWTVVGGTPPASTSRSTIRRSSRATAIMALWITCGSTNGSGQRACSRRAVPRPEPFLGGEYT
jgi:hypothetical protein